MKLDLKLTTPVSDSMRARQVCSLFDVPPEKKQTKHWKADLAIEGRPWNVGLIVGPSGAGKTSVARALFGDAIERTPEWKGLPSVIDEFPERFETEEISVICQAVGFNTIPAWLRPYGVLSNGEKFRVDLARRLLELPDPIVVDEFTSVVDRQVAKIGCHAVQKYVRANKRKFVAVTCHEDVVDYLRPDWVFRPATCSFFFGTGRSLLGRRSMSRSAASITRLGKNSLRFTI